VKPWVIAVLAGAAGLVVGLIVGYTFLSKPAEVRVSPSPVRVVETVFGVPEGCQTAIDHLETAYQALVDAKDRLVDAFNALTSGNVAGALDQFGQAGEQAGAANDLFADARGEAAACLTG
jgi:hypothetical protein